MSKDLKTLPKGEVALSNLSTEELRQELHSAIGLTARAIAKVAAIWEELTRRGEDLSDVKFALRDYMRDVASGRLLPEAVALLAGRVRTLRLVSELPVETQRSLVAGESVDLLGVDGTVIKKNIAELSWTESARVMRDGHLLSTAEQKVSLDRMKLPKRRSHQGRPVRISVSAADGEVRVGATRIPMERLLAALRAAGIRWENS